MPIAVLFLTLYTHAHVGDVLDTVGVQEDVLQPGVLNVEATYGHVLVEDGVGRWVCHETVTAPNVLVSPRYVQMSDGAWVAWTSTPEEGRDGIALWVSPDQCDWTPITSLTASLIGDLDTRGTDIWFATGSQGQSNGLFRITDVNIEPIADTPTDLFADIHTRGPAVWAMSTDGVVPRIWHSLDEETFTVTALDLPVDLATPITGSIAWVDPLDPLHALLVIDPSGTDIIVETLDGGLTTTVLWEAPGGVSQLVRRADGTHLAILNDRRTYGDASGTWEDLDELADSSSFVETADGVWFANRTFVNGRILSRSRDGLTADTSFQPSIITGPLDCPAASDEATICTPLWDALYARLTYVETFESIPPLPTPVEEPESCGCQTESTLHRGWSVFARRR